MIYFTSDTHFNHRNILSFCPGRRMLLPYNLMDLPWQELVESQSAIKSMNEALIEKWNDAVRPGDTVYHLGDFAMGPRDLIPSVLERLNGTIIMVAGNHDNKRDDHYFPKVIRTPLIIECEGNLVELVHNPRHAVGTGDLTFCGHVHDLWVDMKRGHLVEEYRTRRRVEPEWVSPAHIYNVGVDAREFTPRTFAEIVTPRETPK